MKNYEVGRKLGEGSSGTVRLAFERETGAKKAIKIISRGAVADLYAPRRRCRVHVSADRSAAQVATGYRGEGDADAAASGRGATRRGTRG